MKQSSRDRVRFGLSDVLSRATIAGGLVCAFLTTRSPWWAIGAVVLLPLGVWLSVMEWRANRDRETDEALEAAAEYDRTHLTGEGSSIGQNEN